MKTLKLVIISILLFNVGWTKITIVPEDKFISVDGVGYKCQNFPEVNPNIHAIHLSKDKENEINKNVETRDGTKPEITTQKIKPFLDAWKYENDKAVADPPDLNPPPSDELERIHLYRTIMVLKVINNLLEEFPDNEDLLRDQAKCQEIIQTNKKVILKGK